MLARRSLYRSFPGPPVKSSDVNGYLRYLPASQSLLKTAARCKCTSRPRMFTSDQSSMPKAGTQRYSSTPPPCMGTTAPADAQMRITRNPCLSQQDKVNILIAGPLARLRHGTGLWELRKDYDRSQWSAGYIEILCRIFRQVTGVSSRRLSDEDVCTGLGMLSADETRKVDLVRHAGRLLSEPSEVITESWFAGRPWRSELERAIQCCSAISYG